MTETKLKIAVIAIVVSNLAWVYLWLDRSSASDGARVELEHVTRSRDLLARVCERSLNGTSDATLRETLTAVSTSDSIVGEDTWGIYSDEVQFHRAANGRWDIRFLNE